MMITWTQIERGLWTGRPDGVPPSELRIVIALSQIGFIADVMWEGHVVHRSERECLCTAKQDAAAATIRAIALREEKENAKP